MGRLQKLPFTCVAAALLACAGEAFAQPPLDTCGGPYSSLMGLRLWPAATWKQPVVLSDRTS